MDLAIFGHTVINPKINEMVRKRWGPMQKLQLIKSSYKLWQSSQNAQKTIDSIKEWVRAADYGINEEDSPQEIYEKIVENADIYFRAAEIHSTVSATPVFWQIVCMSILVGNNGTYLIIISTVSSKTK